MGLAPPVGVVHESDEDSHQRMRATRKVLLALLVWKATDNLKQGASRVKQAQSW